MTYGPGNDLIPQEELDELSQFINQGAMPDGCHILRSGASGGRDQFNKPIRGFTEDKDSEGNPIVYRCRLITFTPREVEVRGQIQLINTGLRMPIGTNIKKIDRIRYVQKWGRPVTPIEFEIVGGPVEGSLELQFTIARATNKEE